MNRSSAQQTEPILHWLEDETFYSLYCRQHIFSGLVNSSSTSHWLFNCNQKLVTHDFPCNIKSLKRQVLDIWGTPDSIIFKHTIAPMFFPFQSEEHIAAVMQAMHSTHVGSIKYRLGLLAGRFGGGHPLKACFACMESDLVNHGVAYWHLTHQYPGVILCPIHSFRLRECTLNRQSSERHQWILPIRAHLAEITTSVPNATTEEALKCMGAAVIELATYGASKYFDLNTVRRVYKKSLAELGTCKSDREIVASSFAQYTCCLQPYPPFTSLPTSTQCAIAFIAQLTRNPRGHCHPLKHLTLITWLFRSLGSFIEAYERLNSTFPTRSEVKLQRDVILDPLNIHDGVKPQIHLKPKKLKPLIRLAILECLRNGDPKIKICSQFEISICTINKLLRSEPVVAKLRTKKYQEETRSKRRNEWLATVQNHLGISPKKVRSIIPGTYQWLYRNDNKWLLIQTHKLPTGRHGNYSRVDWIKRDYDLSTLISKTLKEIYRDEQIKKLKKNEIFTLVPSLSCALENRAHYPKTRKLLTSILQSV